MEPIWIRIVTPIVSPGFGAAVAADLQTVLRPPTRLDEVAIEYGPESIESDVEEALAVPGMLQRVLEAERAGCDAVVLNCVGDPGLAAARELVSVPVIGPGQAGMHFAAMLGARFSVIVALESGVTPMEALCSRYGLRDRLASVRALGIPVLELTSDPEKLLEALFDQARQAIERDHAHVILLGSTGMATIARQLAERLATVGTPVPVVDPLLTAAVLAESLVAAGLRPSKMTYPLPAKTIPGFGRYPLASGRAQSDTPYGG